MKGELFINNKIVKLFVRIYLYKLRFFLNVTLYLGTHLEAICRLALPFRPIRSETTSPLCNLHTKYHHVVFFTYSELPPFYRLLPSRNLLLSSSRWPPPQTDLSGLFDSSECPMLGGVRPHGLFGIYTFYSAIIILIIYAGCGGIV